MTPTDTPQLQGPARFRGGDEADAGRSVPQTLAAALALLVLLVGVPLALWLLTGPPPFPTGLPSRSDLTQPVDVDVVLTVLRVVVWLAWLQFAVCVVVEAVSVVRGHGLPRPVPLSGMSQQLARTLVSALLLGGVLAGGSGAAAAATAPDTGTGHAASTNVAASASAEADQPVDGTQPTRSADERRDEQAAEDEGSGRGSRVRADHAGVPSTMTDVIGKKVYVVQPPKGHYHDNLWDIAERHLGDGRRWKEIYNLNDGRQQPDGRELVLGRLIQPGWVLAMPEDAVGLERVAAVPTDDEKPAPQPAPADGTPSDEAPGESPDTGIADDTGSTLARDLMLGGLLSAGVLGALAAERRRRRGGTPDEDALDAEVALRVGADEDRAAWLDRALRGLSATCRREQTPLPPVFAVAVDDRTIDLRVAPARPDAPAPWSAVDDGRTWRLHRDAGDPTELGHAPYPGLVCVGRALAGHDLLVDLESVGGVVSVNGNDQVSSEVVSAIAVQLATNAWTDEQRVTGHHLSPVLADVAGKRLRLVDDLEPVLTEMARTQPGRSAGDVLTGRLARRPGVVPEYVVLGAEPDGEVAERLLELTASGSRGFGVVTTGTVHGTRWQLRVDESGTLSVPLLDEEVDAVRLTARSAEKVAALFTYARTEQPAVTDRRVPVPTPPREGDDGHWSAADVRVGVLGPVETRATGVLDPTRVPLATEVVTFLALQSAPVHPSVLAASVWPRGVTAEVRDATVARVREWLGADADGNHHLRADEDGRLSLAPTVAVDWHALCELVLRARRATAPREEAELLRRALHLVRGELLESRAAGRYAWVARTNLETQVPDVVVDAAHRLVELCHDDHDPSGAATAARAGLRLAPGSQQLWRDLVRSEFDRDGTDAAATAAGEMADVLAGRGALVEAETEALVEELLPAHEVASG